MLKQRIITAAILIPLFLLTLFKLPLPGFSFLTGILVFWAATEWSVFMGLKTVAKRLIFPAIVALGLLFAYYSTYAFYLLYVALFGWIMAAILVVCYPKGSHFWGQSIICRGIMGFLVLVPSWLALNFIRYAGNGAYILLFLFVIIWTADISAYFVGRRWGQRKILPAVSPGKSWEGLMGALAVTSLLVLPLLCWYPMPYASKAAAWLLTMIVVLFSVLGDLFESMLKRNVGLKDSGTLLPGHGGILDRIDSLTAAAPVFLLGLIWMNKLYFSMG